MKAWTKISILSVILCLYIVIGGVVFMYLEQGESTRAQAELFDFVKKFLANNSECGIDINATKRMLKDLEIARLNHADITFGGHPAEMMQVWSLQNAVVLCFTIVTTMGFGWITPRSFGGQMFCICYAIIGIPLEGYMLSVIGDTFHFLFLKCSNLFGKGVARIKSKRWRGIIGSFAIIATMWAFLIIIPAAIFMQTENWSFQTAQYFNVVSLTTIGFGDVTPSHVGLPLMQQTFFTEYAYKLGVMLYMFLSMASICIVYVGVWRSQKKNMKRAVSSTRLCLMKRGIGKNSTSQTIE
ncbi:potassium channel subfamily K member 2-like [Asterias rubens]|uniref:potassium channel subfamily K member 2-like n=1 Tax=Asterias rubens TaxID=7604 RepID=UPI001455D313|nr:potassium channel subfamily K member 2-like [Asterias rubens]